MATLQKLAVPLRSVMGPVIRRSLFSSASNGGAQSLAVFAKLPAASCTPLRFVHDSSSLGSNNQAEHVDQPTGSEKDIDELFADEDRHQEFDPENKPDKQRNEQQTDAPPKKRFFYSGINRVELLGGVAADPLVTVTRSGQPYANFRMFTNVPILRRDGQYSEIVEVHNVTCFGQQCRYVKNNVSKGTRVYVSGRLHYLGGYDQQSAGRRTPRVAFVKGEIVQALAPSKRNSNDGHQQNYQGQQHNYQGQGSQGYQNQGGNQGNYQNQGSNQNFQQNDI
jgi:single-strand DNA-binding protein